MARGLDVAETTVGFQFRAEGVARTENAFATMQKGVAALGVNAALSMVGLARQAAGAAQAVYDLGKAGAEGAGVGRQFASFEASLASSKSQMQEITAKLLVGSGILVYIEEVVEALVYPFETINRMVGELGDGLEVGAVIAEGMAWFFKYIVMGPMIAIIKGAEAIGEAFGWVDDGLVDITEAMDNFNNAIDLAMLGLTDFEKETANAMDPAYQATQRLNSTMENMSKLFTNSSYTVTVMDAIIQGSSKTLDDYRKQVQGLAKDLADDVKAKRVETDVAKKRKEEIEALTDKYNQLVRASGLLTSANKYVTESFYSVGDSITDVFEKLEYGLVPTWNKWMANLEEKIKEDREVNTKSQKEWSDGMADSTRIAREAMQGLIDKQKEMDESLMEDKYGFMSDGYLSGLYDAVEEELSILSYAMGEKIKLSKEEEKAKKEAEKDAKDLAKAEKDAAKASGDAAKNASKGVISAVGDAIGAKSLGAWWTASLGAYEQFALAAAAFEQPWVAAGHIFAGTSFLALQALAESAPGGGKSGGGSKGGGRTAPIVQGTSDSARFGAMTEGDRNISIYVDKVKLGQLSSSGINQASSMGLTRLSSSVISGTGRRGLIGV